MPVSRSVSTRKATGDHSNGHSPLRRNHHRRTWPSAEREHASQQARIEELQAQIRWLQQQREQVSWLFEAVPIGYVLVDEHGNISEFNRELEKMLGYKRGVLAQGSLARLVVQNDVPAFLDHLRRCKYATESVSSELRLRNG